MRRTLRHITPALALLLLGACAYGGEYGYDRGYAYYDNDDDYSYDRDYYYYDDDVEYYEYERDYDDDDTYYGAFPGPWIPPGHMKHHWD